MLRVSSFGVCLLLAGCALADRPGMAPLAENAPALSYEEMLNRARGQATAAHESFYLDAWNEVDQAAQRLEQSARLLPKSTQIPEPLKTKIEAEADQLRQDAQKLGAAARARNATQVNEAMQRINQRIRLLRPMDK